MKWYEKEHSIYFSIHKDPDFVVNIVLPDSLMLKIRDVCKNKNMRIVDFFHSALENEVEK